MSVKIVSSKKPTEELLTSVRCINLDWLEVHCLEPVGEPRDPAYFVRQGFVVHEREYGTRVYLSMFTLDGTDGLPLLEVRRDPASKGLYGIHAANECHIRLVNRTCYFDNAAGLLADFLRAHGYFDIRISRVDVCLDFTQFDRGDDPQAFVRRYFRHVYSKINQGNISSHGKDTWSGQEWNSLSWGAPASDVGTKMYDKTLELYDAKLDAFRKPYIREAWLRCHLIDDMHRVTLNNQRVRVWRVEFSVRSSVKKWFKIELDGHQGHYQSIRNTLDCWNGRDRLLVMFASLAQHYFRFKYFEEGIRKDRCKDKVLFVFTGLQYTYRIDRENSVCGVGRNDKKPMDSLMAKIRLYQESNNREEVRQACDILLKAMEDDNLRWELANPWSYEELEYLRRIMAIRTRHPDISVSVVMAEVKKLLAINDKTATF